MGGWRGGGGGGVGNAEGEIIVHSRSRESELFFLFKIC